jgi:hypothetical protein
MPSGCGVPAMSARRSRCGSMQPSGQRVEDLMKYIAEYHADAMQRLLDSRKAG